MECAIIGWCCWCCAARCQRRSQPKRAHDEMPMNEKCHADDARVAPRASASRFMSPSKDFLLMPRASHACRRLTMLLTHARARAMPCPDAEDNDIKIRHNHEYRFFFLLLWNEWYHARHATPCRWYSRLMMIFLIFTLATFIRHHFIFAAIWLFCFQWFSRFIRSIDDADDFRCRVTATFTIFIIIIIIKIFSASPPPPQYYHHATHFSTRRDHRSSRHFSFRRITIFQEALLPLCCELRGASFSVDVFIIFITLFLFQIIDYHAAATMLLRPPASAIIIARPIIIASASPLFSRRHAALRQLAIFIAIARFHAVTPARRCCCCCCCRAPMFAAAAAAAPRRVAADWLRSRIIDREHNADDGYWRMDDDASLPPLLMPYAADADAAAAFSLMRDWWAATDYWWGYAETMPPRRTTQE